MFFFFFSFSKFWFFGMLGGTRAKNGPKWQKILFVTFHISGILHHMIVIYGTHVLNDNIPRCFTQFFKILIFCVVRGVKRQKIVKWQKITHVKKLRHISEFLLGIYWWTWKTKKKYFNIYKFHFLKKIMKNTCGYHYQNLNDM